MRLKVKFSKWTAGLPVSMLNRETAIKLGVDTEGIILIKTLEGHIHKTFSSVDTVEGNLVEENEVLISTEVRKRMNLKKGQVVDVNISPESESLSYIKKKLYNKTITKKEIDQIIHDIINNSISGPEISLFVAGMSLNGMNERELISMIESILSHGNRLSLKSEFVVDKHSIGGVPGNRTTPLVVSICAAGGLIFPKTSSRAITSEAGTADVIEAIADVEFSIKELKEIIRKTNAFLVWGGSLDLVPADSKIIRIEKKLKIDPESQMIASIMAKKIAVGSRYILIDIPYGKNTKVTKKKAEKLKRKFTDLAKHFHKKIEIVLTEGSQPIGRGIGPALELIDIINILDPKSRGPKDLEDKSLFLAGKIFEITGKAKQGKVRKMAQEILNSGKAFEKFKQIIKAQNRSFKKIKPSRFKKNISAKTNGKIKEINNKDIVTLARILGCPGDKSSGIYLNFKVGEKISKRDTLLTLYAETENRLNEALKFYYNNKTIKIRH